MSSDRYLDILQRPLGRREFRKVSFPPRPTPPPLTTYLLELSAVSHKIERFPPRPPETVSARPSPRIMSDSPIGLILCSLFSRVASREVRRLLKIQDEVFLYDQFSLGPCHPRSEDDLRFTIRFEVSNFEYLSVENLLSFAIDNNTGNISVGLQTRTCGAPHPCGETQKEPLRHSNRVCF